MVTIGVVFESDDFDFSGKAHQVSFIEVPPRGECITIDFLADEKIDHDLADDMDLAGTDWFRVLRSNYSGGSKPSVDIFVSPVLDNSY